MGMNHYDSRSSDDIDVSNTIYHYQSGLLVDNRGFFIYVGLCCASFT